MDSIRKTSDGILIPNSLLKGLGDDLTVQVSGDVLIVEPAQRRAARTKLKGMLRRLRRAGRDFSPLGQQEIRAEVDKVRVKRARHS